MKTPEQMAEEWMNEEYGDTSHWVRMGKDMSLDAFIAGYQAAKDEYKEAIDTYNDVAKQMMEEAIRIMSPKDQAADADKVMNSPEKQDSCEHILDMDKMVDVKSSNNSNGWVSVKERLPESSVGWTTVYGCILSRWAVQPGFYTKDSGVWVSRFVDEDEDYQNYVPFESVTHWQPLPKPPEVAHD